jgi:hypothetical protein
MAGRAGTKEMDVVGKTLQADALLGCGGSPIAVESRANRKSSRTRGRPLRSWKFNSRVAYFRRTTDRGPEEEFGFKLGLRNEAPPPHNLLFKLRQLIATRLLYISEQRR